MVKERNGVLGRLREAFRAQVVAPEQEYVRHTEEEREALLAKVLGVRPAETDAETPSRERR
jgi:hypothetical protein